MSDDLAQHFFKCMDKKMREKHLREKQIELDYAKKKVAALEAHIAEWNEMMEKDIPTDQNGQWP